MSDPRPKKPLVLFAVAVFGLLSAGSLFSAAADSPRPCSSTFTYTIDFGSKPDGTTKEEAALQAFRAADYAESHPKADIAEIGSAIEQAASRDDSGDPMVALVVDVQGDSIETRIVRGSSGGWVPQGGSFCAVNTGEALGVGGDTYPSVPPDG